MDVNTRVTQLEDELKVIKNEVLAVLLDMKESLLNAENPFSRPSAIEMPAINITQSLPAVSQSRNEPAIVNGKGNGHKKYEEDEEAEKEPAPAAADRSAKEVPKRQEIEPVRPVQPEESKALKRGQDIPSPNGFISEDTFRSWQSNLESRGEEVNPAADFADSPGSVSLDSLSGLVAWVQSTSEKMGRERIQTILDISEMMGQIPPKLKVILERLIPAETDCRTPERVPAKIYLDSLRELARLLNKKNASDFIVLHIVSQGLNSIARAGHG
jgi:hypothetical protein